MSCSLSACLRGYNVSLNEGLSAIATGFSGKPYADRHWALAAKSDSYLAHIVIGALEYVPVIGGLIAISERTLVILYNKLNQTSEIGGDWHQLMFKTYDAVQNMQYNGSVRHRFNQVGCPKETAFLVNKHWFAPNVYIHANKVAEGISKRSFVASQAPLPKDQGLFWKAMLDHNYAIIDLTGAEDLKIDVTPYYPTELNQALHVGTLFIKLVKKTGNVFEYEVKDQATGSFKIVKRYHFEKWPDHGVVDIPSLHELVTEIETTLGSAFWVHCKAGVGRTGTLITALLLKEKIASKEINRSNFKESLEDLVLTLRKQRGPLFVQTMVQFDLLYRYGQALLNEQ